MKPLKIISTGAYIPERVVTNDDLSKMVDTSDAWIRERTGIRERHIAADDECTSILGAKALEDACRRADMAPGDLDAIIVGTSTPDAIFPSTACWLEHTLGLSGTPAFDVMAGCSGFLYGLEVAAGLLASGAARRVGLVGAECMSRVVDWTDRRTCVLFGDGAGAAIVEPGDGSTGVLASNWGSDGTLAEILCVPAGGAREPASEKTLEDRRHFVQMEGSRVFIHAVKAMSRSVRDALEAAGLSGADVDVFIPHQANLRIMDATRERTGIPADRVFSVLDRYGNISAASVPVAIHEAREQGVLKDGDILALTAFGTGLTWAGAVLRV
ncbi:MAG: ketoacyl-ACP synthase III [Deltaproteobacteria bacterium]|nr:MAG: ketoacyl-ACP synthase III [Deltaproteobacteria bacterium]